MQPMFVPSGNVYLIKAINITNDYQHTIYFENEEEQKNYFLARPHKMFNNISYQRTNEGYIKLQVSTDELVNYSYMMFQNREFTNKWYYAFITRVEYISNVASKVYYEIDVIQTYMFDYVPAPCMVVRQHSETDNIGDNLVNENINIGDYINRTAIGIEFAKKMSVVIMYNPSLFTPAEGVNILKPGVYNGVYNGAHYICVELNPENTDILDNLINALVASSFNGVTSVFMLPSFFIPNNENNYYSHSNHTIMSLNKPGVDGFTDIDGYTPKNNKLFTYPYVCINTQANGEKGVNLAFEYFSGNTADFDVSCNFEPGAVGVVVPKGYNGSAHEIDKAIRFGPYPICTWSSSALVNWYTNNFVKTLTGFGDNAARTSINRRLYEEIAPNSENIMELERKRIINKYRSQESLMHMAVQTATDVLTSSGETNIGSGFDALFGGLTEGRGPIFHIKTVRAYQAKIIDDYFTRFGYAVNRISVPNKKARKSFTYVKTQGYARYSYDYYSDTYEKAGMPNDVWDKIVSIHDNGITYWVAEKNIGNYDIDNGVIKEVG